MLLPGPSGCRQLAPGVQVHHWEKSRRSTRPAGGVKTSAPGTRFSFGGGGVPGGDWLRISASDGGCSAVVTYPVAATNAWNWALVTSVRSIQKPSTRTRCAGVSSGQARSESVPIVNSPPGIQTIPGRGEGLARPFQSRVAA